MSKEIERIQNYAIQLAEAEYRTGETLPAMLVLDGKQGEAVLRLSFAPGSERARLMAKARLMATALQARACACIFETTLLGPRISATSVIVIATGPCEGGGGIVSVFVPDQASGRPILRPFDTGLAGPRSASILAEFLEIILPDDPSGQEAAHAWKQLESMGVTIGCSGRVLH